MSDQDFSQSDELSADELDDVAGGVIVPSEPQTNNCNCTVNSCSKV